MDLADRWPLPAATALRDALLRAWGEETRGYHDLTHLTEVLDRLEELGCGDRAVVLAAWFHDAVYDGHPAPEERSAQWASSALAPLLAPAEVSEVARLVRLTETHRPAAGDAAGAALTDADLAILAAGEQRYAEYLSGVRKEYAHLSDVAFAVGRATVLRRMVGEPALFHTAYGREHWEQAARANVARELA